MALIDRYRNQAQELVDLAKDLRRKGPSASRRTAQSALKAKFEKLARKIEAHSQFEDAQLFKYFHDHDSGCKEALQELGKQHADLVFTKDIIAALGKEDSDLGELEEKITAYHRELLQHLEAEERALVHRWLNLDANQYSTYRSYLSWKYGAMY